MKLKITQTANGWIVDVIDFGFSSLKEPYGPNIYVFQTTKEMFAFIMKHYKKFEGDVANGQ